MPVDRQALSTNHHRLTVNWPSMKMQLKLACTCRACVGMSKCRWLRCSASAPAWSADPAVLLHINRLVDALGAKQLLKARCT
jgi:hypothetical protein